MNDDATASPPGPSGPVDRRLVSAMGPARWTLLATVGAGLLATAATAATAVLLAALLAGAFPGADVRPSRLALGAGLAGAVAVRAAAVAGSEMLGRAGAARVKATLRSGLLRRSLAPGQVAAGPGELATLAGRGLEALDAYVARCLPDLVLAVLAPVVLVGLIAALDWVSALVVAVTLGLFPVFGMLVGRSGGARARARWAEVAALGDHLVDLFDGLPVLRALGRSSSERAAVAGLGERLRRASHETLRVAFLSALVLDTLASVATALVAVPIGLRLVAGSMRLWPALGALLLTPEVFVPLRRASAEFHESAEGLAATRRVLDLVGRPEAGADGAPLRPAGGRARARRPAALALEQVDLSFPGRTAPVLAGASLAVAPGETVVLVGENGAGKSSVIALLLGLVRPDAGRVLADGADLAGADLAAWRSRCSLAADRPVLLPASLADNLRLADPAAGDAALVAALEDAGLGPVLARLPGGLDTRLGDGGLALSAGEHQRVALARALVRRADCYLLDEPTAHLDPDTEAAVVARLAERLGPASALVVTHRPAPLGLADRVVSLEAGRLVELDRRQALELALASPLRPGALGGARS